MIYIGSDHAGFSLKEIVIQHLNSKKIIFKDCGCFSESSCDYPDIAKSVCMSFSDFTTDKAILICGTGVGMSIVANRFPKIRAVCASDCFSVKFSRLHNDSNVLCIGARVVAQGLALELIDIFLNTKFEAGRHKKRIDKIK